MTMNYMMFFMCFQYSTSWLIIHIYELTWMIRQETLMLEERGRDQQIESELGKHMLTCL
jgi:hypothetical protein